MATESEDLSSKKNVRWHVEPYLTTMRMAVQRVIRGDDTTTKIANSYKIPPRTLRRYVSKEKLARAGKKLSDGTMPKSILNPDTNAVAGKSAATAVGMHGHRSISGAQSMHTTARHVGKPAASVKHMMPRQPSQPIAIQSSMHRNPFMSRRAHHNRQPPPQTHVKPASSLGSSLTSSRGLSSSLTSKVNVQGRTHRLNSDLADSFSEILNGTGGSFSGTVSSVSPPSSLVDRFGPVGADWDSGLFSGDSNDVPDASSNDFGGPPVIGQGGMIVDPGVGTGRARSGGFLSTGPARVEKRNRGVSADLLLEAFGSPVSTNSSSVGGLARSLSEKAEAKRRNRSNSRDLLRVAFEDDATFQAPPESFSTQLLRAGLRERARSSSKGRSDSFDFSAWQADFTEQFLTPSAESGDGVLSSSVLSRVSGDTRSRGNSMWSNDEGDDMLMPQMDAAI